MQQQNVLYMNAPDAESTLAPMRRIFFTTRNNGDGSSSACFFESQECIDKLEQHDPEGYGSGEGGDWFEISANANIEYLNIETMAEVIALVGE